MRKRLPFTITVIIIILVGFIIINIDYFMREDWARQEANYRFRLRWQSTAGILNSIDNNTSFPEYRLDELLRRGDNPNNLLAIRLAEQEQENPARTAIAIYLLYRFDDVDADTMFQSLIEQLANEDDYNLTVMLLIARYLGSNDKGLLPLFKNLLNCGDPDVVHVVKLAIEHINDPNYKFGIEGSN